jgi:hypothetical protein
MIISSVGTRRRRVGLRHLPTTYSPRHDVTINVVGRFDESVGRVDRSAALAEAAMRSLGPQLQYYDTNGTRKITRTHTHTHTNTHTHARTHTRTRTTKYTRAHTGRRAHTQSHTHTHTHTHTQARAVRRSGGASYQWRPRSARSCENRRRRSSWSRTIAARARLVVWCAPRNRTLSVTGRRPPIIL